MKALRVIVCSALVACVVPVVHAETALIATGEYAPLVSQEEADDGVTAVIVTAAFKASGIETKLEFMPWKRGFADTEIGRYVGTFPYVRNAEREAQFLYTQPIFFDRIRLFVREGTPKDQDWNGKSICVPIGYDTSYMKPFTTKYSIKLENPSEMKHCFLMLERGRVDGIWASELVGYSTIKSLFGSTVQMSTLNTDVADVPYHLIVSRKLADGPRWVKLFNSGLEQIRKNGTYRSILNRYGLK